MIQWPSHFDHPGHASELRCPQRLRWRLLRSIRRPKSNCHGQVKWVSHGKSRSWEHQKRHGIWSNCLDYPTTRWLPKGRKGFQLPICNYQELSAGHLHGIGKQVQRTYIGFNGSMKKVKKRVTFTPLRKGLTSVLKSPRVNHTEPQMSSTFHQLVHLAPANQQLPCKRHG
jgi:hypothetical protein